MVRPLQDIGPGAGTRRAGGQGRRQAGQDRYRQEPGLRRPAARAIDPPRLRLKGGRPVDGFQGAIPESQVKAFIERLTGPAPASEIDNLLAMAKESLELGDLGG